MRNIPPGWDSLSSSLPWRIDRSYRRACKSCRDCPGRNPRKSRRRFWLSDGQKKSTAQPGMTMRRNQVPKEGGSLSSGISCLASKSAAIEAPPARVFVPVDTRDSTSQPLAVTIVLVHRPTGHGGRQPIPKTAVLVDTCWKHDFPKTNGADAWLTHSQETDPLPCSPAG